MTPAQCRAARGLVDLTQVVLGERAGVDRKTIHRYESGTRTMLPAKIQAVRHELERAGVEFLDDDRPGVRIAAKRMGGRRMAS